MEEVSALTVPVYGSNNIIRESNYCSPIDLAKISTKAKIFIVHVGGCNSKQVMLETLYVTFLILFDWFDELLRMSLVRAFSARGQPALHQQQKSLSGQLVFSMKIHVQFQSWEGRGVELISGYPYVI